MGAGLLFTQAPVLQLKQAEWAPDFGPSTFIPRWGATVTGARKFLIAFNVNLLGTKEQAHRIALNLREQGRGKDQASGWACAVHLHMDLPDPGDPQPQGQGDRGWPQWAGGAVSRGLILESKPRGW